jgi:RNA polymerase sigma factor (TIGR02999 family)
MPRDVTRLLQAVESGKPNSTGKLFTLVYAELRSLAARKLSAIPPGQTLQATALVHEAWLRLVGEGDRTWQNRAHFFSAAAEAMRRILIENARRKYQLRRGGGWARLDFEGLELASVEPEEKILAVNDALEAFQKEDPEKARIVALRFFGGLTNQEVAEGLGTSERTVERHWAFAKARLFQLLRTRVSP